EARVDPDAIPEPARQRLVARYGPDAFDLARLARPDEFDPIPGSNVLRVELRWAAAREAVWHLDDLMLRRVRLGVQLPSGGAALLERIRSIVQPELGWDDHRWAAEVHRYTQLWRAAYSLPLASHAGRP
ncbi:MAG: glycerol-3-phosphate dehydrogenase C-terminal domain-containing protein, partial [Bacillota bacterium]